MWFLYHFIAQSYSRKKNVLYAYCIMITHTVWNYCISGNYCNRPACYTGSVIFLFASVEIKSVLSFQVKCENKTLYNDDDVIEIIADCGFKRKYYIPLGHWITILISKISHLLYHCVHHSQEINMCSHSTCSFLKKLDTLEI